MASGNLRWLAKGHRDGDDTLAGIGHGTRWGGTKRKPSLSALVEMLVLCCDREGENEVLWRASRSLSAR